MALELNPTLEIRLRDHAARRGLSIEQLLEQTLVEASEKQSSSVVPPNERLLAALDKIRILNEGRPVTSDGSDTKRLLREARAGVMYDC